MADNLTKVLTEYTVYIDSSSLMHGSMEFFKISLYNVLRSTKRKLKIVDFVIKDLQKKQFSDNEKFAVKALKVIEFYRSKDLVEDVISRRSERGKILDVIYNNRDLDNNDIVLITDNKTQANEIVTSLSNNQAVDFNHKIAAVRLISGPALWDVKTVKPRVMPIGRQKPLDYSKGFDWDDQVKSGNLKAESIDEVEFNLKSPTVTGSRNSYQRPVQEERTYEPPKYEAPESRNTYSPPVEETQPESRNEYKAPVQERSPEPTIVPTSEPVKTDPREQFAPLQNSRSKRNKLVVSMVIDNSSSLSDERETKLREALVHFNQRLQGSDIARDLDLAVFGFDGFSPRVIKSFDEQLDISKFDNGGIQVLGKTIDMAMVDLADRQKLYASHSIVTHKPWLIVLADGGAYGDLSGTAEKLKKVLKDRKVTYFPFSLNAGQLDESLDPITRLKMFLKVKDDMFIELFDFIFNTLQTRINTPKDDLMRLDKKAIQGFVAR
jgi:uncharacterized protein YegL